MGRCACRVGVTGYGVLQFVALSLLVIATPIDMFRDSRVNLLGNRGCLTMWGYKEACYSNEYSVVLENLFELCRGRRDRFRAAEVLTVGSIVLLLLSTVCAVIMLCCCRCLRWVCMGLTVTSFSVSTAVWGMMSQMYFTAVSSNSGAGCKALREDGASFTTGYFRYGAGFYLIVISGWLNFISIIFLLLPC